MTTDTPITYHPFSNGGQWSDWQGSNCHRCTKYNPDADTPEQTCAVEFELSLGGWEGDGKISEATAKAMGFVNEQGEESCAYVWPCALVEWKQEWQDTVARRKGFKNAAEMLAAKGGE